GTVTFFLCQPSDVTAAGCPTGSGTQVGAVKTLSGGVATSDATSPPSVPTTAIGKYCCGAGESGDTVYTGQESTHTDTSTNGECFTTVVQASQTDTASTPSANNVVPGTSVSDTATVTPVVSGQPTPTGSVKFFLCQPAAVTAGQGCVSGGD